MNSTLEVCQVCRKKSNALSNKHLASHRTNLYDYSQLYGQTKKYANILTVAYPKLTKEWHPTKNENAPKYYTFGSHKRVWWLCKKDHEWETTINNRTSHKLGCPYCSGQAVCDDNSLLTLFPQVASEWHPTKNENTSKDYTSGSREKVWWLCSKKSHEWVAMIKHRTKSNSGCPYCSGRLASNDNNLNILFPKIAAEWHPEKNSKTSSDYTGGSKKKVWWICNKEHEWLSTILNRTLSGSRCPYCAGKAACDDNSLAILFPKIAAEWHPTRNLKTPKDYTFGSAKKVWWLCKKGHEWKAAIGSRTATKCRCPYCAGKLAYEDNNLATLYPEITSEWHPTKNEKGPKDYTAHTPRKKVWWLCKTKGHEWVATIASRTEGRGCPDCYIPNASKIEKKIAFELSNFILLFHDNIYIDTIFGKQSVDYFIPDLSLVIEYDGSYYHKDRIERDTRKTSILFKDNKTVIRLRCEPLTAIADYDVIIPREKQNDVKYCTIAVLKQIEELYHFEFPKLDEYISTSNLLSKTEADQYIQTLIKGKTPKV